MWNFKSKTNLIKRYARGSVNLMIGRFTTKEEKDKRRKRILEKKFK